MSVVVGIVLEDKVIMGCDSQVSTSWTKRTLTNKNNFKIFKPEKNPDVLLGVCGSCRDANILKCIDEYIDELEYLKGDVDFKYVVNKIVPNLFNILRENGRILETNEKGIKTLPYMEVELLFSYKNQLYKISPDGCVIQIDDYAAIGSGADNAIGFLNTVDDKNMNDLAVIKSIESACKTDLYVNYPIIIMNTKNDKVEILK